MADLKKPVRILLLLNWREQGKWDLYRSLLERFTTVDVVQPYAGKVPRPGWFWRLSRYWSEFYLPLSAYGMRNRYDVIVSWTLRMGTVLGLLRRLPGSSGGAKHLLYDFHVNLERNDPAYRLKMFFTRPALPGIDYFLTTSTREETIYSRLFSIPRSKMGFFPIAPPRYFIGSHSGRVSDYIFTYGNSDRDFDLLVDAVTELPARLVILSQAYSPRRRFPDNITLITKKRIGQDLIDLIAGARMVVLPLVDYRVAAGQTAMLESMAVGRPLIVTANLATLEYGRDGDTVLFHHAGDGAQLRRCIESLLASKEQAEAMGRRGQAAVSRLPDRQVALMARILSYLSGVGEE
ncbi:MAG: hypothetical protein AUK55_10945 [Syntrophobacteraceae bacterium CG2_30_61_12]|nr:MAG: hypothetical protein AUK55_10945 [Syntrophobacteraceae bacterium CG2_30_61_12]